MDDKLLRIIEVDKIRTEMLLHCRYAELINSYRKKQPNFIDQNNSDFWKVKIKKEFLNDYSTNKRINFVLSTLVKYKSKKILDIGVGQAYIEKGSKSKNLNIDFTGVDILDLAKHSHLFKSGVYKLRSFQKLPFKKEGFDALTVLEVLEHIKPNALFTVINEFYRVLKRNGILIVSVPINEHLENISKFNGRLGGYQNPNSHLRNYNETILKWELNYCNFSVTNLYRIVAFKKFGCLLNLVNKFLRLWEDNDLVLVCKKK